MANRGGGERTNYGSIRTLQRRRCRRHGAAAVEFALVAPIFIILVLGMIEVGRALMVQQLLINASREGARQASLGFASVNDIRDSVTEYLSSSSVTVSPGNIVVAPNPTTASNGEPITVSISVPYENVNWLPGSTWVVGSLQASTSMRSELP